MIYRAVIALLALLESKAVTARENIGIHLLGHRPFRRPLSHSTRASKRKNLDGRNRYSYLNVPCALCAANARWCNQLGVTAAYRSTVLDNIPTRCAVLSPVSNTPDSR